MVELGREIAHHAQPLASVSRLGPTRFDIERDLLCEQHRRGDRLREALVEEFLERTKILVEPQACSRWIALGLLQSNAKLLDRRPLLASGMLQNL